MNIEPCVRLGIRISPKIKENPADNKNNKPPNVTLLTVSSSQNVMRPAFLAVPAASCVCCFGSYPSALGQWRIIARIDRMGEEFGFRPGPELADILVGLD